MGTVIALPEAHKYWTGSRKDKKMGFIRIAKETIHPPSHIENRQQPVMTNIRSRMSYSNNSPELFFQSKHKELAPSQERSHLPNPTAVPASFLFVTSFSNLKVMPSVTETDKLNNAVFSLGLIRNLTNDIIKFTCVLLSEWSSLSVTYDFHETSSLQVEVDSSYN